MFLKRLQEFVCCHDFENLDSKKLHDYEGFPKLYNRKICIKCGLYIDEISERKQEIKEEVLYEAIEAAKRKESVCKRLHEKGLSEYYSKYCNR